MVMWFRRPQGPPSGVWTGQRKPQDYGRSFRTVVVFIYAKYAPLWIDLKWDRNLMLFSLSAITANPLSCIRSKPVRDLRLPVDRNDSRLLPIMPVSSSFLILSIEISLVSKTFDATASLMILALTYERVSSSFYLNIIRYKWPGRRASWTAILSRFSGWIYPLTRAYNLSIAKQIVLNFSLPRLRWGQMFSLRKISPASLSV